MGTCPVMFFLVFLFAYIHLYGIHCTAVLTIFNNNNNNNSLIMHLYLAPLGPKIQRRSWQADSTMRTESEQMDFRVFKWRSKVRMFSHSQRIIIIIISTTMFMVLSSWQSHCESSPGSFDECRMAPSGRRPKTKPDDLGCESTCTGCTANVVDQTISNAP